MVAILFCLCISLIITLVAVTLQLKRYKIFHQYDIEDMDSYLEWIVNDAGELGVKVGNRVGFLYKGYTIEYGDDGDIKHYREVYKREFGECCISPLKQNDHLFNDGKWKRIPAKPQRILPQKK